MFESSKVLQAREVGYVTIYSRPISRPAISSLNLEELGYVAQDLCTLLTEDLIPSRCYGFILNISQRPGTKIRSVASDL